MLLEVCSPTLQSAINADIAGAQRIELCQNLGEGGTTPSWGAIRYCAKNLKLKSNILIRPRGGNFCYSHTEFEEIKEDIRICKELGVNGVVIGFLHDDRTIDTEKLRQAIAVAGNLEITFHRAFDICTEREEALEKLIDCGCHRVLTSGFCVNAFVGRENLRSLVARANGRIEILAGCGVTAHNVRDIIATTGVREVHSSCKTLIKAQENFNPEIDLDITNLQHIESSVEEIQNLLAQI